MRIVVMAALLALPTLASAATLKSFKDCAQCPEMVVIPAGTFTMGSSDAEKAWAAANGGTADSVTDEAPQHVVEIQSFALGKYDVTRGEYAQFVRETGHSTVKGCYESSWPGAPQSMSADWRNPGFKQTDRDPVVCVSWLDAKAYVSWLNGKTRHTLKKRKEEGPYRLPSEAEWEYAARAGTTTRFWWGDAAEGANDNAWYKSNSGGHTHRVGSKPANGFGLHDMAGNVWQWTEDCYEETYAGAPIDGSAHQAKDDCLRVDRGSAWIYPAWLLRSATRERNRRDYRDAIMGFRVARTLATDSD